MSMSQFAPALPPGRLYCATLRIPSRPPPVRRAPRQQARPRNDGAGQERGNAVTPLITRRHRTRNIVIAVVLLLLAAGGVFALRARSTASVVPVAVVTRGEFINYLPVRGQIKANHEVMMPAPAVPTDLQIIGLAQNGATVKPGDVLAD